jgi:activating signal cointegrator complex subunit 3
MYTRCGASCCVKVYIYESQAHLTHLALPISDYVNDTKSVLDQALRVLNAMVDIAADEGNLASVLTVTELMQCIVQACQALLPCARG